MKNKYEDIFIKNLEAYFDETYNDFTKKKIATLLEQYKNTIEPVVVFKEKRSRKNIEPKKVEPVEEVNYKDYKAVPNNEKLTKEVEDFCDVHQISPDSFLTKMGDETVGTITELRKKFCQMMMERYIIGNKMLADLFTVHHTTITYYLYGKPYRPKKDAKLYNY